MKIEVAGPNSFEMISDSSFEAMALLNMFKEVYDKPVCNYAIIAERMSTKSIFTGIKITVISQLPAKQIEKNDQNDGDQGV